MKNVIAIASALALLLTVGCASTSEPPPSTTPDGLELVRSDKHSALYMKPEARLDIYAKFGIVPCQVAFRKNWQRDYNSAHRGSVSGSSSATSIASRPISVRCTTFFTDALSEEPAYDW